MANNKEVFCLTNQDGSPLAPSIQATVLAKYSRSPLSAKEILKSLTGEEADKFQEKWVISYGHSSVAELASIPICFEGVSIIASKFIEQWQRAGYSEKSTRYQEFSADSFVTPTGCPSTMKAYAARLYSTYRYLQPRMLKRAAELMGLNPNDPNVLAMAKVKARAFDNIRYLLPAGTGTNVAAVMNLRDVRYLVSAARGHSNVEIQELGEQVFKAVSEVCPALVKEATPDMFELPIRSIGNSVVDLTSEPTWRVKLHDENKYVDAVQNFKRDVEDLYGYSWEAFSKHMEQRGEKQVPRVFKTIRTKFEITMDYGAFRDLQRHRRCEQYVEPLTADFGYLVPDDILGTDMESEYRTAMESIKNYGDESIVHNVDMMQYMIPLGYLHRSIFEMDLRELYYISELRTKPQGHISYRRVAYEMFSKANKVMPDLMKWCRAERPDSIGEHHLKSRR